jgi:hypothetical protein
VQPDPSGPIGWEERRADGAGGLAARAGKRLTNEGMLYTTFAPALLRMRLGGELAPMWASGHVEARALWDAFARYVYLPRLVRAEVLYDCVRMGPSGFGWEVDGFATADAYDESALRYRGLTIGSSGSGTPSTLVVQPELALAQQAEQLGAADPQTRASEAASSGASADSASAPSAAPATTVVTRFYGVVELEADRAIKNFSTVAQEVIGNLVGVEGADVHVVVEIRARRAEGFADQTIRTVTENAKVLGFTSSDFEAD